LGFVLQAVEPQIPGDAFSIGKHAGQGGCKSVRTSGANARPDGPDKPWTSATEALSTVRGGRAWSDARSAGAPARARLLE
jgi:hypothetical protein